MTLSYAVESIYDGSTMMYPLRSDSLMTALYNYDYVCSRRMTQSAKLFLEVTGDVQLRIELLSFEETPAEPIDYESRLR